MSVARAIRTSFLAVEKVEGLGARIRRGIGIPQLRNLSPFVLLDHFTVPAGGGFPEHPHRGQQTITYMLQGSIDHEDFTGSRGSLEQGDLQFMTAGRGIMHSEMPRPAPDGKPTVGVQLWVDLPVKLKTMEPRYRDLRASKISQVRVDDGRVQVKVISGTACGASGPADRLAYTYAPLCCLDIEIRPGGLFSQAVPRGWNAFAYTLSGTTLFGPAASSSASSSGQQCQTPSQTQRQKPIDQYHTVVFEQSGESITASVPADAKENSHFLIIAGQPLDQTIVQYGPFVVTSMEEGKQATRDYKNFQNGFERARGWMDAAVKKRNT